MSSKASCRANRGDELHKLRGQTDKYDYSIAIAGNPNTGKSTVFNALTGLNQHTGNWPGKTVARAEGAFSYKGKKIPAGGFTRNILTALNL